MPIYDHLCDHCGHAFSVVRSFKDPEVEQCPSCGKRPRRLIAKPAIVFKGSGWYKTDSRPSSTAASDSGASKDGGGGGGGDKDHKDHKDAKGSTKSEKTAPSGGG